MAGQKPLPFVCILTGDCRSSHTPAASPLPLPYATLLRPGFSFCSCCPILCGDGERHWLPHHAGEGPGARGRGGGLNPAVRGAQPDPDVLLGVSEGGDSSSWHWERGSPAWHPSSNPPQLLLHLPLGHSSTLGMNTREFLSLSQCSHTCPHPIPGRMQPPASPKAVPSHLPLWSPASSQTLTVPCCGRARLPGLQPCCHPSQVLLLPASLADLPLLPRRLGCSWGAWPSCCYPQHCLLNGGPSCCSPPCRWPPGCSRKSCCGAGTG